MTLWVVECSIHVQTESLPHELSFEYKRKELPMSLEKKMNESIGKIEIVYKLLALVYFFWMLTNNHFLLQWIHWKAFGSFKC